MTKNGRWVSVPEAQMVRAKGLEQAFPLLVSIDIYFQAGIWTNEIAKLQVSINSNISSIDCKNCNWKWKFVTGNRT